MHAVRSSEVARRRRNALLTVLGLAATIAFVVGASSGSNGEAESDTEPLPPSAELPGGGQVLFPDRRVIALYGAPQDPQLGALGIGSPDEAGEELEKQAQEYE